MDIATIAPATWGHAVRVFGTEERTPEEVLASDPEDNFVEAILDRIEYGVFS